MKISTKRVKLTQESCEKVHGQKTKTISGTNPQTAPEKKRFTIVTKKRTSIGLESRNVTLNRSEVVIHKMCQPITILQRQLTEQTLGSTHNIDASGKTNF